jgi:hypothetical protein
MASNTIPTTPGQPLPMDPSEYALSGPPNILSFAFDEVPPPSTVYIQRDDLLVLAGTTQLAGGDTITMTARLLTPTAAAPGQPSPLSVPVPARPGVLGPGYIQTIQRTLALPVQGTQYSLVIPLAEGYLLSVAITSAIATLFGQTYTGAYIGRGAPGTATPIPSMILIADYPTNFIPVGWPSVPIRQTASGQGVAGSSYTVSVTPGSSYIYTTPANSRTRIHSIIGLLTTSSSVGNRYVYLYFRDASTNPIAVVPFGFAQVASTVQQYSCSIGAATISDTTNLHQLSLALPDIMMGPGWSIVLFGQGLFGGDVFSACDVAFEQWVQ